MNKHKKFLEYLQNTSAYYEGRIHDYSNSKKPELSQNAKKDYASCAARELSFRNLAVKFSIDFAEELIKEEHEKEK